MFKACAGFSGFSGRTRRGLRLRLAPIPVRSAPIKSPIRRKLLDATRDDPERLIGRGPLQLKCLVGRCRHLGLDLVDILKITGIASG